MTTTAKEARAAIVSRFRELWDPADADVGVDNVAQAAPADATRSWGRLLVRVQASAQETLGGEGNSLYRHVGSIMLQLFVPRNGGVRAADELAAKVKAIFRAKSFGGVRCYSTTPREVGVDGPWFQVNVDTEFDFDEVG